MESIFRSIKGRTLGPISSAIKQDLEGLTDRKARYKGRVVYRFSVGHSGLSQGVGFSFDVLVDEENPEEAVKAANLALSQMNDTFEVRGILPEPLMNGTLSLNPSMQVTDEDIVDGPYRYD